MNSLGEEIPERTDGDLLFVYDYAGGSGPVTLEVREWDGIPDDLLTPENEEALFGAWSDPLALDPGDAFADINGSDITRPDLPGDDPFGGGTVAAKRFGEFAVNVADLFGEGAPSCPGFASFWAKSRASGESFNSVLKDKVGPQAVDVSSCGTVTISKVDDQEPPQAVNGAEFTLYLDNGDGLFLAPPDTAVQTCTTGEEGIDGECTFEMVAPGTYFVAETDPPDGYAADPDPQGPFAVDFRDHITLEQPFVDHLLAPAFVVDKIPPLGGPFAIGQTVTYTVRVTNTGDGPGATPAEDDYDQDHVTVSDISDAGTDDGSKIDWATTGVLDPDEFKEFSYDATFKGPFADGDPVGECDTANHEFEVSNTASAGGSSDTERVCVTAAPAWLTDKIAPAGGPFAIGQTVTYTVRVTNTGDGPGATPAEDDYDQDHVTVSDISDAGTDDGSKIDWATTGVLDPDEFKEFSYDATFKGPFADGDPVGECDTAADEFEVSNTASAGGSSDTERVCVTAAPAFTIAKEADPTTVNLSDGDTSNDVVGYKVTVTNTGEGPGAKSPVTDDYDGDHLDVDDASISDAGTDDGSVITWATTGTLNPGEFNEFTYTGTILGPFTSDEDPEEECEGANVFPVANSASIEGADPAEATVCVTALPAFTVDKSPDPTTVNLSDGDPTNDTVHYTITVTNIGQGPGSTPVTDDYDQNHLSVSNIDPPDGSDDGDFVTWADSGTIEPTASKDFTYDGTVIGPFTSDESSGSCEGTNVFAVANSVTVDGDSDAAEVCVTALPAFTVDKSADPTTVNLSDGDPTNDTVHYTITVTNIGQGPGSTPVTDDYDQNHLSVSNIDPADGVDDGDLVTWADSGTIEPTASKDFTYDGTVIGPFTSEESSGSCEGTNVFAVANSVTVDGDSDSAEVCVIADPNLTLEKSADAEAVGPDALLTYTIAFANDGQGPADDVTIGETIPEKTEFVSCTGGCETSGDPVDRVTWDLGTLEPGESGSVSLTVRVEFDVRCVICNTATITAPTFNRGDPFASNELCVIGIPGANPAAANADGSAFAAHVEAGDPLGVDETFAPSMSAQAGVGSDAGDDEELAADVPPGSGTVLDAHVLRSSSSSDVTVTPAEATQTSFAEAANVELLGGLVEASFVRAVATAEADGTSSSFDSTGSAIEDLVVDGVGIDDVAPGDRIDLPAAVFGDGSYVALFERTGATGRPGDDELVGGTYSADLAVTMIHVHVTGLAPLSTPADVEVANAVAHADFPQIELCQDTADRSVSGHAFVASAGTSPEIAPVTAGFVDIPATGGHDHQDLEETAVPEDGSDATTGEAVSDSIGELAAPDATSSSYAEAANVCVMPGPDGCTIRAEKVRSQSNSLASATGASSDDTGTELVGLEVAGVEISETPDPNTTITLPAGLGFVTLNEQICDNEGTLTAGCSDGTVAGHSGLTVRAIHVTLVGQEIVVAEAHGDAFWEPGFTVAITPGAGGAENAPDGPVGDLPDGPASAPEAPAAPVPAAPVPAVPAAPASVPVEPSEPSATEPVVPPAEPPAEPPAVSRPPEAPEGVL